MSGLSMLAFDRREWGGKCLCRTRKSDTCLTRLTWDFQPFLAVTRASGVWHVNHASGLTSECAIYASACEAEDRWKTSPI